MKAETSLASMGCRLIKYAQYIRSQPKWRRTFEQADDWECFLSSVADLWSALAGACQFQFLVQLPLDAKTDSLSAEIIALDPSEGTGVEWKPEKTKGS